MGKNESKLLTVSIEGSGTGSAAECFCGNCDREEGESHDGTYDDVVMALLVRVRKKDMNSDKEFVSSDTGDIEAPPIAIQLTRAAYAFPDIPREVRERLAAGADMSVAEFEKKLADPRQFFKVINQLGEVTRGIGGLAKLLGPAGQKIINTLTLDIASHVGMLAGIANFVSKDHRFMAASKILEERAKEGLDIDTTFGTNTEGWDQHFDNDDDDEWKKFM